MKNKQCCEILDLVSWLYLEDGTKLMPNINGYRVNFCPCCGKRIRDIQIKQIEDEKL